MNKHVPARYKIIREILELTLVAVKIIVLLVIIITKLGII